LSAFQLKITGIEGASNVMNRGQGRFKQNKRVLIMLEIKRTGIESV